MNAANHLLLEVKTLLEQLAYEQDAMRLADCLRGKFLPALGGQDYPADILYRSLVLPPFDPELLQNLAELTAILCNRQAQILEALPAHVTAADDLPDEFYTLNLLLFASYLPARQPLFEALNAIHAAGLRLSTRFGGRLSRIEHQLRQALIYQQTDDRLEEHWLSVMKAIAGRTGRLTPEQRDDLMEAWRGLLWIPPSPEQRALGETLCAGRVEKSLSALDEALRDPIEATRLLRYAVRQLRDAYPRSPQFWHDFFEARLPKFPELLQDVLIAQWPILAEVTNDTVTIPEDVRATWEALTGDERTEIEIGVEAHDKKHWNLLWNKLWFSKPRNGIPPQQWRLQLQSIKKMFEESDPALKLEQKHAVYLDAFFEWPEDNDRGKDYLRKKGSKGKGKGIDRLSSFERVNSVLEQMERLLRKKNQRRAKDYFEELINHQQQEGTEDELISKTLCNAATLVCLATSLARK